MLVIADLSVKFQYIICEGCRLRWLDVSENPILYFNTSYVKVAGWSVFVMPRTSYISIHHMWRLQSDKIVELFPGEVFQYIICEGCRGELWADGEDQGGFQYIICEGCRISVRADLGELWAFQYIICEGCSLFVRRWPHLITEFQYIICEGCRAAKKRQDGRLSYFNTSYVKVAGYTPEEFVANGNISIHHMWRLQGRNAQRM